MLDKHFSSTSDYFSILGLIVSTDPTRPVAKNSSMMIAIHVTHTLTAHENCSRETEFYACTRGPVHVWYILFSVTKHSGMSGATSCEIFYLKCNRYIPEYSDENFFVMWDIFQIVPIRIFFIVWDIYCSDQVFQNVPMRIFLYICIIICELFSSLTRIFTNVLIRIFLSSVTKDSRLFGYDAVMRPEKDDFLRNTVLIPAPTSGSLEDCTVIGWQLFVQIISVRHAIFLQVWRPTSPRRPSSSDHPQNFTLVGQTFIRPTELRYIEITLEPRQYLRVRRGDVLGLHFPDSNPIGWTAVPCAFRNQAVLTAVRPSAVSVGRTLRFDRAPSGQGACRQYSFSAILGWFRNYLL